MNNVDKQYLDLLQDILNNGSNKNTRAGEVLSVFGRQLRFNLKEGLPILTTKKVFTRGVIHELLWFLSGNTNIKYLVDNNVHIWDDDAYRYYTELIKKHNEIVKEETSQPSWETYHRQQIEVLPKEKWLDNVKNESKQHIVIDKHAYIMSYTPNTWEYDYKFGDLGNVYGYQWRNQFGIDQIKKLIETLKTNPDDRRMLCMTWNNADLENMALPPCHYCFQLYTRELSKEERFSWFCNNFRGIHIESNLLNETLDKFNVPKRELSLMWNQRSVDCGLGLPFNILSYSILTYMLAQVTNMAVGEVVGSLGDCHIYLNQLDGIREQLARDPNKYSLPKLSLNKEITNIDDFKFDDIKIEGYESYSKISLPLSVG